MNIEPGQSLKHYKIIDKIGAGGMGEVWRASDTRLDRDVAIKVLPPDFAANEQYRARFEREARTISSLNHPNICTLFDVGEEDGTHFLVMELIEGESLANRIRRERTLPIDQVTKIGAEIALALDAAHRSDIVHRDLKPDNIMLTRSGAKLLDFGLAKASGFVPSEGESQTSLPTQAEALTEQGMILGTFQYMAPEQLEGAEADARTDLFALGAILYEMATGRKAFEGKGRASLIAAIVEREPEAMSSLQPKIPQALERIVALCLRKDPAERWQTAHDVRLGLEWIDQAGSGTGVVASTVVKRDKRERIAWAVAALLLLSIVAVGWVALERGRLLENRRKIVATIQPPQGSSFESYGDNIGSLTLSPDGNWMSFVVAGPTGRNTLFVRPLDSGAAQPMAGTEDAKFPFWSPDSQWIGFFSEGKIKKIPRSGGAAITVATAMEGRGGTWNEDGVILFAAGTRNPISRVSAGGGPVTQITELDLKKETTHRYPVFLPDGKHFLFLRALHDAPINSDANALWIGSLETGENVRLLQSGTGGQYVQGHLLYVEDGFLMAQPWEPDTREFTGDAFAVGQEVSFLRDYFRAAFAASETGLIAYQQGGQRQRQLVWMDREGERIGETGDFGDYGFIRLSPDETKLAVTIKDPSFGTSDVWVYDIPRNVKSRLTFHEANDGEPVWSPDGTQIVFLSRRNGPADLWLRKANGSGEAELLWSKDKPLGPVDWSPDGKYIAVNYGGVARTDLWIYPVDGDSEPFSLVSGEFDEGYARFSPDGAWIAYLSNESGTYEIYATPFPGGEGKWQLSTEGAGWLVGWKEDSTEIYYLNLEDQLCSIKVTLGEDIVAEVPETLFQTRSNEAWDSSDDGERFVIGTQKGAEIQYPITLIVNWLAD